MAPSFTLREDQISDSRALHELVRLCFLNLPQSDHSEHLLVQRLHQSPNFVPQLSLVAEDFRGDLLGYILLSKITIKTQNEDHEVLALAPLCVHPNFQRQGIGSALMQEAISKAKALGFSAIIVLGHKDYYPRFGFEGISKFKISSPIKEFEDYLQVLPLKDLPQDFLKGELIYPKEFAL